MYVNTNDVKSNTKKWLNTNISNTENKVLIYIYMYIYKGKWWKMNNKIIK